MNSSLIIIGIFIVILSTIIYFIKNSKEILKYVSNNKIVKNIIIIIEIVLLIFVLVYSVKKIIAIKNNVNAYIVIKENRAMYALHDKKIQIENNFYKNVMSKEYLNQNSQSPYIPDGFEYIEGTWNTGFVIQDSNKNQYVWIPCTNKENTNIPILKRKNFATKALISKDTCNNENYEEFLTSALENGGFYISRYEIGKENEKPVSKANREIFKNVNRDQANNIIEGMYKNINCELINGYAYDTTLSWVMSNNKTVISNVSIDNAVTGRKAYNNIYDLFDNIMELTLETSYDTVIIRGYPYENADAEEKILSVFDMTSSNVDRQAILKEESSFATTTLLGFRTIIYK